MLVDSLMVEPRGSVQGYLRKSLKSNALNGGSEDPDFLILFCKGTTGTV